MKKNNNNNKAEEGREEARGGGVGGERKIEILSTATSTQIPNHKTKKTTTYKTKNSVNKLLDRGS